MRIPHPQSNLSPAQILAYTIAALLTVATITTAALLVPILGILLLVLLGLTTLVALAWFSMSLYHDHADRRAQRRAQFERVKPGELLIVERAGVQLVVDPHRSASPAIAITPEGITPLLPVDEAQTARNIQAAAIQLAQAAPTNRAPWGEILASRQAPAVITSAAPPPPSLLEQPQPTTLERTRVELTERMGGNADQLLLGVNAQGQEVRAPLHDLMHTGMLAATGGGKTTTLSAIALQLAADPSVEMVIADPHMMELALLEDTGALHAPMPQNARQAVEVLGALAQEIHRRAELVNRVSAQVKAIKGRREILHRLDRYNRAAATVGAERLPALVAFGDEIPALAAMGPGAEAALRTITSEGRKFGVYFIGASQSWKASVISTDVRSQFWSRLILPGAPVRQVAELFEIEQSEARQLTEQLTAPGIAALWRRGAEITLLKTPYIDLESDRVYRIIEDIAQRRQAAKNDTDLLASLLQKTPETRTENMETFPQPASVFSAWENDFPQFPAETIDVEKREKVLELRDQGKGKTDIIREVWGATSGRRYQAASAEYDAMTKL